MRPDELPTVSVAQADEGAPKMPTENRCAVVYWFPPLSNLSSYLRQRSVPQWQSLHPWKSRQLLLAWSQGEPAALEKLVPLVHAELSRLAHHYMAGERTGHTLQTTALVNEAYLRLVDSSQVRWQNRAHFMAVSAQLMRRILVDFARSRNYLKRGAEPNR